MCLAEIAEASGLPKSSAYPVSKAGLIMFTKCLAVEYAAEGIRANAFCHQMVRSIVGVLVRVGLGQITPGDVRAILVGRDRSAASQIAPPHGLCLWEVGYPAPVRPAAATA